MYGRLPRRGGIGTSASTLDKRPVEASRDELDVEKAKRALVAYLLVSITVPAAS
jgi:hypothetical protein